MPSLAGRGSPNLEGPAVSLFGPLLFVITLLGLSVVGVQHGGPDIAAAVAAVVLLLAAGVAAVADADRRSWRHRRRIGLVA